MLSIAVLHYNNNHLTDECVKSVDRQYIPVKHEKIIIDNGSSSPTPLREGWRIVRVDKNCGNIGGQNACFAASKYSNVLFVSNDVRFMPGCIAKMIYDFNENTQLMPEIRKPNGEIDSLGLEFKWPGYGSNIKKHYIIKEYGMDAIPSITYMMSKEVFKFVRGFDKTFVSSHEDLDMGFRLRKMGFELKLSSGRAVHLGNQTLGKMPYYNRKLIAEARKKFIDKHYSGINRFIRRFLTGSLDTTNTLIHEALFSHSS